MVFKEPISQQKLSFLKDIFDLKKYVSIYTRKQIGQKMEGVSAS